MTQTSTLTASKSSTKQGTLPLRSRRKRAKGAKAPLTIGLDRVRMKEIHEALNSAIGLVLKYQMALAPGETKDQASATVNILARLRDDYDGFLWKRGVK